VIAIGSPCAPSLPSGLPSVPDGAHRPAPGLSVRRTPGQPGCRSQPSLLEGPRTARARVNTQRSARAGGTSHSDHPEHLAPPSSALTRRCCRPRAFGGSRRRVPARLQKRLRCRRRGRCRNAGWQPDGQSFWVSILAEPPVGPSVTSQSGPTTRTSNQPRGVLKWGPWQGLSLALQTQLSSRS
jgi:hypothetical protein